MQLTRPGTFHREGQMGALWNLSRESYGHITGAVEGPLTRPRPTCATSYDIVSVFWLSTHFLELRQELI